MAKAVYFTNTNLILTFSYYHISIGFKPYDSSEKRRGPGDLFGIVFQNISIAAPSVLGKDLFYQVG